MGNFRSYQRKKQAAPASSFSTMVQPARPFAPSSSHAPILPATDLQASQEQARYSGWSLKHIALTREDLPSGQQFAVNPPREQATRPAAEHVLQRQAVEPPVQKEHTAGLPGQLKAGLEQLSGLSLENTHVHYNSPRPARLQALAYTQGSEIHIGPGQEQHLAHEAWHVVQQKQGRVQPTMQMKEARVNGDEGLEREADIMGERAGKIGQGGSSPTHSLAHLPIISSRLATSQNALPSAAGTASANVIQRKPVYYHRKEKEQQNSYRDSRDKEAEHIFEEEGRDTYKLGKMMLYYNEYDQYTTDDEKYWDPVTGKLFTIDDNDPYVYYDDKNRKYRYKSKKGESYYIEESPVEESKSDKEESDQEEFDKKKVLDKKRKKGEADENEEKQEVKYAEKKPKITDVDRAIKDRFDIHEQHQVYYFYPKGVEAPKSGHRGNEGEKPTGIGMISWEAKKDSLSFDVSKFNPDDKTYPAVGYAMVYYLLKKQGHYETVKIDVFQTKQDNEALEKWYQGMGFGSDFTGDTTLIRDNCKRLYAEKG